MPVPGLDPGIVAGIHVPLPTLPRVRGRVGRGAARKTWMAGTSPAMTLEAWFNVTGTCSSGAKD
jgi:hypothetical protein